MVAAAIASQGAQKNNRHTLGAAGVPTASSSTRRGVGGQHNGHPPIPLVWAAVSPCPTRASRPCYTGPTGVVEHRPKYQVRRARQPGASGHCLRDLTIPHAGAPLSFVPYPPRPSSFPSCPRVRSRFSHISRTPLTRKAQESSVGFARRDTLLMHRLRLGLH
jgi:hypothetical protein